MLRTSLVRSAINCALNIIEVAHNNCTVNFKLTRAIYVAARVPEKIVDYSVI